MYKRQVDAEGKVHQPLNPDRITSWEACGVTDDFVWTNEDLKTFQGVYQGNHHVISGALFCGSSAGLISSLEGAVVNLRMEHCASIAKTLCQAIVVGCLLYTSLHYAAHGHTAAEVIYQRADAEKPFMGLTSFAGELPALKDIGCLLYTSRCV